MDHNKLWEILKVIEIPNRLTCLPRNLYAVKKKQLKPNIEQLTGSKLGEDYDKAVYCHPAYLTYMQRKFCAGWITSWNQGCWENNLRYVDDTTLMAENEELKSLLMSVKEENEKAEIQH